MFLELLQEALGSPLVVTGTLGNLSCCLREVRPPFALQAAPRDSSLFSAGESSQVEAGNSGFLSSCNRDFRVPIKFQQVSQASSRGET